MTSAISNALSLPTITPTTLPFSPSSGRSGLKVRQFARRCGHAVRPVLPNREDRCPQLRFRKISNEPPGQDVLIPPSVNENGRQDTRACFARHRLALVRTLRLSEALTGKWNPPAITKVPRLPSLMAQ
jgi:hypothetical protein